MKVQRAYSVRPGYNNPLNIFQPQSSGLSIATGLLLTGHFLESLTPTSLAVRRISMEFAPQVHQELRVGHWGPMVRCREGLWGYQRCKILPHLNSRGGAIRYCSRRFILSFGEVSSLMSRDWSGADIYPGAQRVFQHPAGRVVAHERKHRCERRVRRDRDHVHVILEKHTNLKANKRTQRPRPSEQRRQGGRGRMDCQKSERGDDEGSDYGAEIPDSGRTEG